MSWITPITNRNIGSRTTATDMNRIAGNINELLSTTLKADYTNADIVKDTDWNSIISNTNTMADELGITRCTDSTRFDNLNVIENIAKLYHEGSE